jgi:hypothetical protein
MRKLSHPKARFNGRPKLPGWPRKDVTAQTLGQVWLLEKREVKEVNACTGVSGRGKACLGAWEFLFKGGAVIGNGSISQVRPEDEMATNLQNGDIIVLSFPHFFFNND